MTRQGKSKRKLESSVIPKYKKKIDDAERDTIMSKEKYTDLEKETEKHRIVWHQEVDNIFNKLKNNNEDICASDRNVVAVVVVDKAGRVRFRYDGTPAKRKEAFDPNQLVTDSMSQIIVADWTNDCLHILYKAGQFLKCVDDCELSRPFGLGVDVERSLKKDK
ncbi:uncharacterized protein LOC133194397 [Saccostrea echinata]|uniref:uncharacterized protein LOC133194397 n=1 Tax=Saccostrea echinata TaxID=191078 RepID=UPI002A840A21|nr:uncharacterized protein LOC133194397 [Saccostrea echinata]